MCILMSVQQVIWKKNNQTHMHSLASLKSPNNEQNFNKS